MARMHRVTGVTSFQNEYMEISFLDTSLDMRSLIALYQFSAFFPTYRYPILSWGRFPVNHSGSLKTTEKYFLEAGLPFTVSKYGTAITVSPPDLLGLRLNVIQKTTSYNRLKCV